MRNFPQADVDRRHYDHTIGGSSRNQEYWSLCAAMLNHISIGVSSLANAKAFYDSILLPLGYRCLSEDAGAKGYGQRAVRIAHLFYGPAWTAQGTLKNGSSCHRVLNYSAHDCQRE